MATRKTGRQRSAFGRGEKVINTEIPRLINVPEDREQWILRKSDLCEVTL